jgi:hypothetical protein
MSVAPSLIPSATSQDRAKHIIFSHFIYHISYKEKVIADLPKLCQDADTVEAGDIEAAVPLGVSNSVAVRPNVSQDFGGGYPVWVLHYNPAALVG